MRIRTVRGMLLAAVAALTIAAASARATVIVTGVDTNVLLPGTAGYAVLDGYDVTNMAVPSTFSVNLLVHGDGTFSSSNFNLSQVPYATISGTKYFAFVYDARETGGARSVQIDNVTLSVNGIGAVWSSTDSILLNSTTPYTASPLGTGPDLAVFIPVSAFDGLGLTGSSTAFLTVTQSMSDNGSDEWVWTDRGIIGGVTFFGPDDPIASESSDPAVPEPTTFFLSGGVLLGAGLLMRRKLA